MIHLEELLILYIIHHSKIIKICFVNVGCFEGMLISREIVNKIGFPNKNYFIVGDDLEYGFLASHYTNVSYVKSAKIIRKKNSYDEIVSPTSNVLFYT